MFIPLSETDDVVFNFIGGLKDRILHDEDFEPYLILGDKIGKSAAISIKGLKYAWRIFSDFMKIYAFDIHIA